MILILSKRELDASTSDVMDWLDYLGGDYRRLNGSDYMRELSFSNLDINTSINLDEINVVWFRRWFDESDLPQRVSNIRASNDNLTKIYTQLSKEYNTLSTFFFDKLKDKHWLSNPANASMNKLNVLYKAKKIGIDIPESFVTTSKAELIEFSQKHDSLITKAIGEGQMFPNRSDFLLMRTNRVTKEVINDLPDTFFPSLFQAEIKKKYELRIVLFDDVFYSMAIFSQLDEQTQVDFRNYNLVKPNRRTPYKLDTEIENKLRRLMNSLELTTGSIDMVRDLEGRYVFLEVNPVGQFGMTSGPCNFKLEKKIAEYLIRHDK
ncbi:grasp-with-spasm system ATP-grasp peptide maturase [Roseivirga pacifica]|uniref:grasp-with-spasm system ATP-grasp peptide maturase n=1 Tax=Roseivirga pacifica TaxID=1267423 RepID=UPI00227C1920|nr:grasp-with-spasm system ATP-grasp peptide maturase [Roseivirga pacifica]